MDLILIIVLCIIGVGAILNVLGIIPPDKDTFKEIQLQHKRQKLIDKLIKSGMYDEFIEDFDLIVGYIKRKRSLEKLNGELK
jgi:predicted RNA-binding protein with PIN domain